MKIKKTVSVLMLLIVFNTYSKDSDYCLHLKSIIENKKVQVHLINWVDDNFENSMINRKEVTSFVRIRPGEFKYLNHNFEWNLLNFDLNASTVNLIGLDVIDFFPDLLESLSEDKKVEDLREPANSKSVDSVFFSEKSHYGILVKPTHSNEFIEERYQKYLILISDRIAVLCGSKYSREN